MKSSAVMMAFFFIFLLPYGVVMFFQGGLPLPSPSPFGSPPFGSPPFGSPPFGSPLLGGAGGGPPQKKDGRPRANRKGMLWPAGGRRRWSWWESNPRPNKEIIRFLHAYSRLHFRATARPGPPTGALSSKISSLRRGPQRLFPIFLRRRFLRFGTTSLGRRLVPSPSEGIKLVIYCASIKQREHTVCCQLFC